MAEGHKEFGCRRGVSLHRLKKNYLVIPCFRVLFWGGGFLSTALIMVHLIFTWNNTLLPASNNNIMRLYSTAAVKEE